MVARHHETPTATSGTAAGLFSKWHRALDRVLRLVVDTTRHFPSLAIGGVAVLIGTIGSGVLTGISDGIFSAVRVGLAIPFWAAVRLLVLQVVAQNASAVPRKIVTDAWGFSLVPFAAALTLPLHMIAFVASAVVTWLILESRNTARPEALSLVAWAWGFQIAVLVAVWLARNFVLAGRIVLGG